MFHSSREKDIFFTVTSTFHSFRAVSRFSKQLRPDTSTRVFIKKEKKSFIAQIELSWLETLKIKNQNDKLSRRESVKLESIRSDESVFTQNNLLKMSSKQGSSSSSMFGSSSKSSSSSSSSSSWNKSGNSSNNNGSGNGGKGVSDKMWKDLTEKMAKLDIEIDYRKK